MNGKNSQFKEEPTEEEQRQYGEGGGERERKGKRKEEARRKKGEKRRKEGRGREIEGEETLLVYLGLIKTT